MAESERLTITLPSEMASIVREAVAGGDYASSSDVVQEALQDWKAKRVSHGQDLAGLKSDIALGLLDLAEGRVKSFDAKRIADRGRVLSASRSRSD